MYLIPALLLHCTFDSITHPVLPFSPTKLNGSRPRGRIPNRTIRSPRTVADRSWIKKFFDNHGRMSHCPQAASNREIGANSVLGYGRRGAFRRINASWFCAQITATPQNRRTGRIRNGTVDFGSNFKSRIASGIPTRLQPTDRLGSCAESDLRNAQTDTSTSTSRNTGTFQAIPSAKSTSNATVGARIRESQNACEPARSERYK
jgi:hypothetical protein